MSRLLPVLAVALLAACARGEPAGFDTVGPDYVTGGGNWNTGGGISVAVSAFERDGRTLVCGVWTTTRQAGATYAYNRDVMEVGSVYLAGERLVQNLSFMTEARPTDNLAGASAGCVASAVDWRPGLAEAAPRVRFPRFVVGGDDDEDGGTSGQTLIFREAPRADIVR